MNDPITDLEKLVTQNLQSVNNLKNEVENKEHEKHDQLQNISLSIIDILDSFEQIEESLLAKGLEKTDEALKIVNRYSTIQKKLLNLLHKYGISKIEFPDGRLIVGLCEVVETVADGNKKNDEIISVIRKGYVRGKELIRAAQIIVVKN